jgi:hypothetical protein
MTYVHEMQYSQWKADRLDLIKYNLKKVTVHFYNCTTFLIALKKQSYSIIFESVGITFPTLAGCPYTREKKYVR